MSTPIAVETFHGTVDSKTPLFNRDPGWLKTLSNMRVRPGGWLEVRGGREGLRPSGGTAAPVHSSGYFVGFHQYQDPSGVAIPTANAIVYGRNIAPRPCFRIFGPADNIGTEYPVVGTNVETTSHYWAFGAIRPFTRLTFNIAQGCGGGSTYAITWEYWNGAAWAALTGPTEDFKTAGVRVVDWNLPANWAPLALVGDTTNTIGGVYLYWVRARVSTIGVATQDCWNTLVPILSDWSGHSKLFASLNGVSGGNYAQTRVYGQDAGGLALWMLPLSATGWADNSRNRELTERYQDYQGTCLRVNGLSQRRFDGFSWRNLGFTSPAFTVSGVVPTLGPPAIGQASRFTYYMTLGYGPGGAWGESAPTTIGNVLLAATDYAALTWTFAGGSPPDDASQIHLYRSQDEFLVPPSSRGLLPAFRIATIDRGVGIGAAGFPVAYNDSTYGFISEDALDFTDRTPPGPCRFVNELSGRILLARSEKFPNRGWWSLPGEGEAFDQIRRFVELRKPITGSVVAFDTWFLWSEDEMIGVSDLGEAIPNIFEVQGGTGSVAPNAAVTRYGVVTWLSKDGVYAMGADLKVERITPDHGDIFGKMSPETHGGSWARFYDSLYDVHLLTPGGVPVGSQPRWRFDLLQPHWNESSVARSPLAEVTAPLGHADYGVPHPVFGDTNPSTSDRTPYIGEYTTADAGTGFDCIADIHFGPRGLRKFEASRFVAYYQADSAWGTPVISAPPGAAYIWSGPPGYGTPTPVAGTDYKVIVANPNKIGAAQDIVIRFKATTVPGGVARNQRIVACYLDGEHELIHRSP